MLRLLARVLFLLVSMVPIPMSQNRAEAAGARECDLYARRAVQQYQLTQMARFARRCGVAPSPRWQASYQNHNGWCLTAPRAWLKSEEGARDRHLYKCGAQVRFD
jgi:hypothetical protein